MFSSKRQKINEKEAEVGKNKEMESFALALPTSTKIDKNFNLSKYEISPHKKDRTLSEIILCLWIFSHSLEIILNILLRILVEIEHGKF